MGIGEAGKAGGREQAPLAKEGVRGRGGEEDDGDGRGKCDRRHRIEGAAERLDAIRASVRHAKAHVQNLPREAMMQYTVLLMAPTIVTLLSGIGGRTRPMFNITISNVPGPDKPLYFRGARLEAIYPASIVTHGQALNITCESYAGFMDFGFTGCHSSVPSLQKLAVYASEALEELEAAVLPKSAQPPKAAARPKRRRSAATA